MHQSMTAIAAALDPPPPEKERVGTVPEVIGLPQLVTAMPVMVCAPVSATDACAPEPAVSRGSFRITTLGGEV